MPHEVPLDLESQLEFDVGKLLYLKQTPIEEKIPSGLESLVSRLEKRYAATQGSDEEEVNTDLPEKEVTKKKSKSIRKATKEEIEWMEAGEGFLDDTHYEEPNVALSKLEENLVYHGFYVHRGPLIAADLINRLEKKCTPVHKLKDEMTTELIVNKKANNNIKLTGKKKKLEDLKNSLANFADATKTGVFFNSKVDRCLEEISKLKPKEIAWIRNQIQEPKLLVDHWSQNLGRVELASELKQLSITLKTKLDELKSWFQEAVKVKDESDSPAYWMNALLEATAFDLPLLNRLYFRVDDSVPVVSNELHTWGDVLQEFQSKCTLSKDQGDELTKKVKAMCLGYLARREKGSSFRWTQQGFGHLEVWSETHREVFQKGEELQKKEIRIFEDTKTSSLRFSDTQQDLKMLLSKLCLTEDGKPKVDNVLTAEELTNIIHECKPDEELRLVREGKQNKRRARTKKESDVKKDASNETNIKKRNASEEKPPKKRQKKMPTETGTEKKNIPVKSVVFDSVDDWRSEDFGVDGN